ISNAEARESERRLAEEQAALRRVATLVAEGVTPNRVFDAVREEVARMFDIPSTILMRFDADGMATLLATYGDYLGPVGTRWPLEDDGSAVARVHRTGRAARADYTRDRQGPLAEAAGRGGSGRQRGGGVFAIRSRSQSWSRALSGEQCPPALPGPSPRPPTSKAVWRSSPSCSARRSRTPRAARSSMRREPESLPPQT